MTTKTIRIFYSWQSDLPCSTNSSLIRRALQQAKRDLEAEQDIEIIIDEATRGETGSPDIIETILRKIEQCDFYIADLSIINDEQNNKKAPNPNVLFECGYALHILGWERITLLFNEDFGNLVDLPFDLNRRRITTYSIIETKTETELKLDKTKQAKFKQLIKKVLSSWIQRVDNLPQTFRRLDSELIKNQRDVKNLKTFFSCFDVYSIEQLCRELPDYIKNGCHFDYVINIEHQVLISEFYIYHENLNKLVKEFSNLYYQIIQYCGFTHTYTGQYPYKYKFSNNNGHGDMPLNENQQEQWDTIQQYANMLYQQLQEILSVIRSEDKFIEIDIEELGKQAWNKYYEQILETKREREIEGFKENIVND